MRPDTYIGKSLQIKTSKTNLSITAETQLFDFLESTKILLVKSFKHVDRSRLQTYDGVKWVNISLVESAILIRRFFFFFFYLI